MQNAISITPTVWGKFYVEIHQNLPEQTLVAGDVFGPFDTAQEAVDQVKDIQAGKAVLKQGTRLNR